MDVPHVHGIILLLRCSPRDRASWPWSVTPGRSPCPVDSPWPPPTAISSSDCSGCRTGSSTKDSSWPPPGPDAGQVQEPGRPPARASKPPRARRAPPRGRERRAGQRANRRRAQQHQNDHRRCDHERDAGPGLSCLPPRCARRVAGSRVLRTLRLAPLAPSAHDPGLNSAQRKPRPPFRSEGPSWLRNAARTYRALWSHEPPRITRRADADSAADARAFSV